jgi:hypothetical protein
MEKLEKLKKSLDNKFIPDNMKDKIRAEIKKLESEIKTDETMTATEVKEEVKEIEEKVEKALEVAEKKEEQAEAKAEEKKEKAPRKAREKKTSTSETKTPKVEPKATAKKKSVFSIAKEIRKDGESWEQAKQRASKMMKSDTTETKKKVRTETDKLLAMVRRNKEYKKLAGSSNLAKDAQRRALPRGKRVSADGNVYYENRANRVDVGGFKNAYLENGGGVDRERFNKFISSQINYIISLKTISQKREPIQNLINNMDDYSGEEIQKRITKDNLKYALQQKTVSKINEVLRISLNALKYADGGTIIGTPETPLARGLDMDYTTLVGETGAMSSGELFADGGYAEKGVYVETLDEEIDLSEDGRVKAIKTQQGGNKSFGELREMHGASPEALAFNYGGNLPSWLRDKQGVMMEKGKYVIVDEEHYNESLGMPTRYGVYVNGLKIGKIVYDVELEDFTAVSVRKFDNSVNFGLKEFETKDEALKYIVDNAPKSFAEGGSLGNHGLKQGDQIIKTMSSRVQKVKTKSGDIIYVNLANGYRGDVPQLPFDKGGRIRDRKYLNHSEDYEVRYSKDKPHRRGYGYAEGGFMTDPNFGNFQNQVYAGGGEIRRFDRQAQMDSETREEILDVLSESDTPRGLTNYLYGLYDGYDYSQTENFKKELKILKQKNSKLHQRVVDIYKKIDKYKFEKYNDNYATGGEVSFIEYKDSEIMYEPNYKKYYANDVEFDSLQEAKDFLDSGEIDPSIRDAYKRGLFATGGGVGDKQVWEMSRKEYERIRIKEEELLSHAKRMKYQYTNLEQAKSKGATKSEIEKWKEFVNFTKKYDTTFTYESMIKYYLNQGKPLSKEVFKSFPDLKNRLLKSIEVGEFTQRIKDGKITKENAIKLIENANVEVPDSIKNYKKAETKKSPKELRNEYLEKLGNKEADVWDKIGAESGSDIRNSDKMLKDYAEGVEEMLQKEGVGKGSFDQEDYDFYTDENWHLFNEFLVWNGYYEPEMTKTEKEWREKNYADPKKRNYVSNPSVISVSGSSKLKSTNYVPKGKIATITIVKDGKEMVFLPSQVLNGVNLYKGGGKIKNDYVYIAKRYVKEVHYDDGKDLKVVKPSNGYWVEKSALKSFNKKFEGGGKTTFKEKATAIAKNFEGKKVEPKYQKEYGKTYDKAEAKEVGNKIAGSQKAKYDSKMSGGGKTKRGGAMQLAKQIRKDGESWQSALKRANEQMRNK